MTKDEFDREHKPGGTNLYAVAQQIRVAREEALSVDHFGFQITLHPHASKDVEEALLKASALPAEERGITTEIEPPTDFKKLYAEWCRYAWKLEAALQEIVAGDPAGGTFSGSQCVEIAKAALSPRGTS